MLVSFPRVSLFAALVFFQLVHVWVPLPRDLVCRVHVSSSGITCEFICHVFFCLLRWCFYSNGSRVSSITTWSRLLSWSFFKWITCELYCHMFPRLLRRCLLKGIRCEFRFHVISAELAFLQVDHVWISLPRDHRWAGVSSSESWVSSFSPCVPTYMGFLRRLLLI